MPTEAGAQPRITAASNGESNTMTPDLDTLMMIPGPTEIPSRVLRALSRPMIGHRSSEYADLHKSCEARLKRIFQTENPVLILTSSGTGGMEAAVANIVSPGDKIVVANGGKFGERFGDLGRIYGAEVDEIVYEWGQPVNPDDVAARLDEKVKAVYLTLNETSAGVTSDIEAVAKVVRQHGALVIVDAISGMAAIPCASDEWGLDVVVAGSQKAFMLPPGLAFVSVSDRAWEACEQCQSPRYYLDLGAMRKSAEKGQTAFTPNVSMIFALDEALNMLFEEGLDNVIARHARLAGAVRAAARALGFELLPQEGAESNTVTALKKGRLDDPDAMRKHLAAKYGVLLSGGQSDYKNQIFRIGHMGAVTEREVLTAISCLEAALSDVGYEFERGAGVSAALEALA
ncbi:MAG: pyridoxal-phosphate-dependent aminotransferase family protein [Armatimonadota bacterium]